MMTTRIIHHEDTMIDYLAVLAFAAMMALALAHTIEKAMGNVAHHVLTGAM